MMATMLALLVGMPRSAVGLLLGAGGIGYATVKTRALGRIRRWHVLVLAAAVTALAPTLRHGATSGLQGLVMFVANVVGLATGRLKVVDISGQKTLVETR